MDESLPNIQLQVFNLDLIFNKLKREIPDMIKGEGQKFHAYLNQALDDIKKLQEGFHGLEELILEKDQTIEETEQKMKERMNQQVEGLKTNFEHDVSSKVKNLKEMIEETHVKLDSKIEELTGVIATVAEEIDE